MTCSNDLLSWYDTTCTVTKTLDDFAPKVTRTRCVRSRMPWYNQDVHGARSDRRRAERKWRKSRSVQDRDAFVAANKEVVSCIVKSKETYFAGKLADADHKTVCQAVNNLINNRTKHLPNHDNPEQLSNGFTNRFVKKITKIRDEMDNASIDTDLQTNDQPATCPPFTNFKQLSKGEVQSVITKFSNSTCSLDPQPKWFLKIHLEPHLVSLIELVNASLVTGNFPADSHKGIINTLLKKPTLDKEDLINFRPVCKLSFTAQVIEKCAANQFIDHLNSNDLTDPYQVAYRAKHSTETALLKSNLHQYALLKVQNDILCEFDAMRVVFIILLDLSAAFDTVDHSILLQRPEKRFNIGGAALQWFSSYLSGWNGTVNVSNVLRHPVTSEFGLPQGSIMGPLMFPCYTVPLGEIAQIHCIRYHIYADDTQLYVAFNPRDPFAMGNALN